MLLADQDLSSATAAADSLASLSPAGALLPMKVDVSQSSQVAAMFQRADELSGSAGPASILVTCAGITRDGFIGKSSEEDFDAVTSVNLKGTWLCCRAFAEKERLAALRQNEHSSSIVALSSLVGKLGNLGQSNYAASKAGVLGLTRALARELAPSGVRVNAVLPGFIDTPMTAKVPDKVKGYMVPKIGLGRFGSPENVADLVAFLASDRSSYMTGCEIEIDGKLMR